MTDGSYQLVTQPIDNRRVEPDADDDGEPLPSVDTPGVGLLELVIRLDGQAVTTSGAPCFNGTCESAKTWAWDTSSVTNGKHTITITASAKVCALEFQGLPGTGPNRPKRPRP